MRSNVMRSVVSALTLVAAFGAPCAKADAVADFYRGKTVTLIVSGSAGGGYDTLARLISKFLGKHVPGNPSIIVQNSPGAGSLSAAEESTCKSKRDGLRQCRIEPGDAGGFKVEGKPEGVLVSIPKRLELLQEPYDVGPYLNLSSSNVENRAFLLKKTVCPAAER